MGRHSKRIFMRRRSNRAFTLVELLVVIAIIGILVALLLPAIQAAREAARRTQCKNHVKQLALGFMLHESTYKTLPSGGWRDNYGPDPNRGYGPKQPGSWYYNVLAFIEEQGLRDLGKGIAFDGVTPSAAYKTEMQKLYQSPVVVFYCPSRRQAKLYQRLGTDAPWATALATNVKADYAANAGDSQVTAGDGFNGESWYPTSLIPYTTIDSENKFQDTNCKIVTSRQGTGPPHECQSGVMSYHSDIRLKQITDGATNTYLLGERFLQPSQYEEVLVDSPGSTTPRNAAGYGDNQSAYTGFEWESERVAWNPLYLANRQNDFQPRQDITGVDLPSIYAFGSAHTGGLNMAMCDGSVQFLSYDI